MASKSFYSISAWIMIIGGLGLAGFGLYSVGFNSNPVYAIPLLVVGIIIFGVGVTFYVMGQRKAKQEKLQRHQGRAIRDSQRIRSSAINSRPQDSMQTLEPTRTSQPQVQTEPVIETKPEFVKKVSKVPRKEICMISKLPLQDTDRVLQCPGCQSYFLEGYLTNWLKENQHCPVCKRNLAV